MERKVTEYYDYFKERYLQAQAEIEHLMSRLDKAKKVNEEQDGRLIEMQSRIHNFEEINEAQADQLGQAYDENAKYKNALEKISEDGNSNDFAADPGKWPCNIADKVLKND